MENNFTNEEFRGIYGFNIDDKFEKLGDKFVTNIVNFYSDIKKKETSRERTRTNTRIFCTYLERGYIQTIYSSDNNFDSLRCHKINSFDNQLNDESLRGKKCVEVANYYLDRSDNKYEIITALNEHLKEYHLREFHERPYEHY